MIAKSVYFVECLTTHLTKIGVAEDVSKRLKGLQSSTELVLRAVIPSPAAELEKPLHKIFEKFRHHGEWFTLPGNWIQYIPDEIKERLLLPVLHRSVDELIKLTSFEKKKGPRKKKMYIPPVPKVKFRSKVPVNVIPDPPEDIIEEESYATTWRKAMAQVQGFITPNQVIENKQFIN